MNASREVQGKGCTDWTSKEQRKESRDSAAESKLERRGAGKGGGGLRDADGAKCIGMTQSHG